MSRVLSYCPIVTHLHGISECGRVRQRKEEEEEKEEEGGRGKQKFEEN